MNEPIRQIERGARVFPGICGFFPSRLLAHVVDELLVHIGRITTWAIGLHASNLITCLYFVYEFVLEFP